MVVLVREIQLEVFFLWFYFSSWLVVIMQLHASQKFRVFRVDNGMVYSGKGRCCRKDIQAALPPCENDLSASLAEYAEVNKTCLRFFQRETRLTKLCHAEGKQFFGSRQIQLNPCPILKCKKFQGDCFLQEFLKCFILTWLHIAAVLKHDWMYMFWLVAFISLKTGCCFVYIFFSNQAGRQNQSSSHHRLDRNLLIPNLGKLHSCSTQQTLQKVE